MGWKLQRSQRKGRWYCQAVWNGAGGRTTVGLGYLDEDQWTEARQHVDDLPAPGDLVTVTWDRAGDPGPPSRGARKRAALARLLPVDFGEFEARWGKEEAASARQRIAAGDYSGLTLQAYYDEIWSVVRPQEVATSTWKREQDQWKAILAGIGHLRMRSLSMPRWSAFLASKGTWSGRSKVIAQNAYRRALVYAVEIGIIDEVHTFRVIKGSTKRTLPEPEPLTEEQVEAVLEAAATSTHKALFAHALAHGPRPGEASSLRWDDVDWDEMTVRIRGSKNSLAGATLPLMPLAEGPLRALWVESGRPTEGPCFLWKGRRIRQWKNSWATALRAIGYEGTPTQYLTRHTFASLAVARGIPDAAIRAMMRHSRRSVILERAYTHLRTEQVREAMLAGR